MIHIALVTTTRPQTPPKAMAARVISHACAD